MRLFTTVYLFLLFCRYTVTKNLPPVDVLEISSGANALPLSNKSNTKEKYSGFRAISLKTGDKFFKTDGTIAVDESGIDIIYHKDYIIYKLPLITYKDNVTTFKGDSIDVHFTNPDTTFRYFVIKSNNHFGMKYEKLDSKKGSRFSLDSLLKEIGIHPSMQDVFSMDLGKPKAIVQRNNHIQIYKYLNKKLAPSDPDSIYRFFNNNLNKIAFSYSPMLDKQHNSKLFRTSFIYLYKKSNSENVLKLDTYSELKEISLVKPEGYIALIDNYENDVKSIKVD